MIFRFSLLELAAVSFFGDGAPAHLPSTFSYWFLREIVREIPPFVDSRFRSRFSESYYNHLCAVPPPVRFLP